MNPEKTQMLKWSHKDFKVSTIRSKGDVLGGTVDMNLPANAGDTGSIPGLERVYKPVEEQLGLCAATAEPQCCNNWSPCS